MTRLDTPIRPLALVGSLVCLFMCLLAFVAAFIWVGGGEPGTQPSRDVPLYPQARKVEPPAGDEAFLKLKWGDEATVQLYDVSATGPPVLPWYAENLREQKWTELHCTSDGDYVVPEGHTASMWRRGDKALVVTHHENVNSPESSSASNYSDLFEESALAVVADLFEQNALAVVSAPHGALEWPFPEKSAGAVERHPGERVVQRHPAEADSAPRAVEATSPDEVDDPFAAPPGDDPFALPADEPADDPFGDKPLAAPRDDPFALPADEPADDPFGDKPRSARRAVDAAGPPPPAAEHAQPASEQAQRTPEEQSAIAEIEKLGGKITIDEANSAKPVIGVNFGDTEVTNAELPHLQGLSRLQTLDLTRTKVTDTGLEHLKGFPQLRTLLLRGTQVSDAGVEELRTALPNVHILGHVDPTEGETKGAEDLDLEGQVPISTFDQLQAIQNDLAGDYVLVNDIDCFGFDFEPVGSEESPFTGTLDGQGFVISALSIDRPSDDLVGLFRVARSATIRNVQLWQPVVTGDRRVGALVGRVIGSTVRNVHVGNGRISGRDNIGGLAGRSDDSTFEQVSTSGVVRGNERTSNRSQYFGGLIGYGGRTSVLRSHSSAEVQGKTGWKIGGLVGQLNQGTLAECFSTGKVDGWARVGGLAGHIEGSSATVSDCYALGAVTGTQQVGGFVGLTYQGPTITRSYATGHVTGRTDTGGFLGLGLGGTLSACFWDVDTSGQSGDGAAAGTTGLSTTDMQTEETFNSAGWDLERTWRLADYPRLEHATDRTTEEILELNERELDLSDRAPQAGDAEAERVTRAINSAAGGVLRLRWLETLYPATAEKLAQWGTGEAAYRALYLSVRALDAASAEKLAKWGSGEAGNRTLSLSRVQTLDAATAEELARWGSGEAGSRGLLLTGLETLDASGAEKLAQWGSGDDATRMLFLTRVRALDAPTAEELARWGSGDRGQRTLYLTGVQTLDAATAEELARWGSGATGQRTLCLDGVQTLDASGAEKLAQWGSGDDATRMLSLARVQTLDAATAEELAQWGSGETGHRTLNLGSVQTLDAATAEELARWGTGETAPHRLRLGDRAQRAVDAARER